MKETLPNSLHERVVFPEACVLTDHILKLGISVLENLKFYPENIRRNLELLKGLNMGEAVMIELAKRGVGRQEAHELVRLPQSKLMKPDSSSKMYFWKLPLLQTI